MKEINIQPWSEEQSPSEAEIRRILDKEVLQPYRWSNAPGDVYSAHTHPYHKVIYVVEGSITFGFPDDGDGLRCTQVIGWSCRKAQHIMRWWDRRVLCAWKPIDDVMRDS